MKVIPKTQRSHYLLYLRFHYYHRVDTSAGGQYCLAHIFYALNGGGGVMVFNATFNNISVISWWSVLLVGETGEYPEKTTDLQ